MGFNALSLEVKNSTYFSLKKGFSDLSLGVNTSIGIVTINGLESSYNGVANISNGQDSYNAVVENGVFVIYPFYDNSLNIEPISLSVNDGVFTGESTITPDPSGIFVLDLSEVECINRNSEFNFNPFGFRKSNFTIGGECPPFCDDNSGLGCGPQTIIEERSSMPVLVAGDELSFMLNAELEQNYTDYRVGLVDSGFNFVFEGAELVVSELANGRFVYYSFFDVPCTTGGCYYIVIYNPTDNKAVYVSRDFVDGNNTNWRDNTRLLKYRNPKSIGGYIFEKVPDFYNQIRLDINESSFRFDSQKTSYREQTTEDRRNIQSTSDKYVTFKCFQFDRRLHEAMLLAFDCKEIYLDGTQYRSFDNYNPNIQEEEDLSNGEVELYQVGFSYSSTGC